jgi:hypothetical protein
MSNEDDDETYAKLAREYDVAVRRMMTDITDVEVMPEERKVLLPCNKWIDFYLYIDKERVSESRRIISPTHFILNKGINQDLCLNRCTFLKLKNPEKYVAFAASELKQDRNNALDFMRSILNDVNKFESEFVKLTFDDPPIDVTCAVHLGKAFSQCTELEQGRVHWKVLHGTFKNMPEIWEKRLGNAAMQHVNVVYDKGALANHGSYQACFKVQSNNMTRCNGTKSGYQYASGVTVELLLA